MSGMYRRMRLWGYKGDRREGKKEVTVLMIYVKNRW